MDIEDLLLAILAITGPIYLMIVLGYLTVRFGLLRKSDMQIFGRFVINLALPALVFKAISLQKFGDVLRLDYLLVYGGGSFLTILIGHLWCSQIKRQTPLQSSVSAMGMACSNSGFVGYPILLLILPSVAGSVLALNMVIENLLVIPFVLTMTERAHLNGGSWRDVPRILKRLIRNPLMLGLAAGLAVSACDISLPAVVTRTVDMLAATCGALSLILIGGALSGFSIQGHWSRILSIACGKLILHPTCVLLVCIMLPSMGLPELAAPLVGAALLSAAMPMMGIYPSLAQAYGEGELCSGALLVATMLSFITISTLLALLPQAGLL